MQGQSCQELLKPFFLTNSSKSQATAWADSGKSRRKLKPWKSLETPPQPTRKSFHRWPSIKLQQDSIFISGKSRHTTRGTSSVSLLAVRSTRISSSPVQKPQKTQRLAGGRCWVVFPHFSGDLCSWAVEQSQQLSTMKRENWHKQELKLWWAEKKDPTVDPTCSTSRARCDIALTKAGRGSSACC